MSVSKKEGLRRFHEHPSDQSLTPSCQSATCKIDTVRYNHVYLRLAGEDQSLLLHHSRLAEASLQWITSWSTAQVNFFQFKIPADPEAVWTRQGSLAGQLGLAPIVAQPLIGCHPLASFSAGVRLHQKDHLVVRQCCSSDTASTGRDPIIAFGSRSSRWIQDLPCTMYTYPD